MNIRTLALGVAVGLLSVVGTSIASRNPIISTFSESSVRIRSARIVKAMGGGFYLTGRIEPSFGYVAPGSAHVRVAAYDTKGDLVAEKADRINRSRLIRWHLRPNRRAPYVVFFPFEPSQVGDVTVSVSR